MSPVPEFLMVVSLAIAVYTDIKSRRILNWLTFPAILLGIAWAALDGGWNGALGSLEGGALALALMMVPFALGWTGAGDVKLIMAIGAIKGPSFVFLVCLYAAIVGGMIAVVVLVHRRKLRAALLYLFLFWRLPGDYRLSLAAGSIPYAPAIAVGALAVVLSVQIMPAALGWTTP